MRLLLIEDSASLLRSLGAGLRHSGFTVDQAADGYAAAKRITSGGYDIIVLDLMIPGVDGQTLLGQMRSRGDNTCVLVLSARDAAADRVRILDLGADDYLVKPFDFDELVARVHALMRRDRAADDVVDAILQAGDLSLDPRTGLVSWREVAVSLTRHEIALLLVLLRRPGRVFSHEQLIARLYPQDRLVTRNALEAHVCSLRRKLKRSGIPPLISTRRGFGYSACIPDCVSSVQQTAIETA